MAQAACTLTVAPRSGPPGTTFVIKGSGFTTTEIRLKRGDVEPRVLPVTAGTDPWAVRIVAGERDAGRWHVAAQGCPDRAALRVTLPPTATVVTAPEAPPADRTPAIAGFALLGMVFVGSSLFVLGRTARRLHVR
jgi:hypothetical protein